MSDAKSIRIPAPHLSELLRHIEETCEWCDMLRRMESAEVSGETFRSPFAPPRSDLVIWSCEPSWEVELQAVRLRRRRILATLPLAPKTSDPAPSRVFAANLHNSLTDELWFQETHGFFDSFDCPPWDLWIESFSHPDFEGPLLVFLVPPEVERWVQSVFDDHLDTYDVLYEVDLTATE